MPLFEQGRVYLPERLIRRDYENKRYDAVEVFVEDEYLAFPVSQHDDMLDGLARVFDLFPDNSMPWPARMSSRWQTQTVLGRGSVLPCIELTWLATISKADRSMH